MKAIAIVYANLIENGTRTLDAIKDTDIRNQTIAVLATRKLESGLTTYAYLLGNDGVITNDQMHGVAADENIRNYIKEYAKTKNIEHLISE